MSSPPQCCRIPTDRAPDILADSSAKSPLPPVRIPGVFTVGQGIPGDGLRNSMEPPEWHDMIRQCPRAGQASTDQVCDGGAGSSDQKITTLPNNVMNSPTYPDTLAREKELWEEESISRESYHHREWKEPLRTSSRQSSSSTNTNPCGWFQLSTPGAFWCQRGRLVLWRNLPNDQGVASLQTAGSLQPGAVVQASEVYQWDGQNLPRRLLPRDNCGSRSPTSLLHQHEHAGVHIPLNTLQDQRGQCLILKVEAPLTGYCLYSIDGYPVVLPGSLNELASQWGEPKCWWWKVTCPSGAFVREDLELTSRHLLTLAYGTVVQVLRQRVNNAGLPRLQILGHIYDPGTKSYQRIQGWCSRALNPLSGQRGTVLQPLPLPRPIVYRVVLPQGAVIRQDVELASPVVGQVSSGSLVTAVARAFSDFPADRAVARLRLASGGWISTILNHAPPNDLPVVECVGCDETFDPIQPHLFHFRAQQYAVLGEMEARDQDLSLSHSTDPTDDESMASAATEPRTPSRSATTEYSQPISLTPDSSRSKTVNGSGATYLGRRKMEDGHPANKPCLCCMESPRDATLVHGETGHIVVCLPCARVLQAQGQKCPVCRLEIETVIKHFFG